jgi:PAS domain S-box-containing protein
MTGTSLTGIERRFADDDVIVTKTDLGGRLTYANRVFLNISSLTEKQALGAPHNIIRHPSMPAVMFRLLWDTIKDGREIFAYVMNRASNGDHYWVFAHVTPSFDQGGSVIGYHSNRRVPDQRVLGSVILPLYAELLKVETEAGSRAKGIEAALARLNAILANKGTDYERFIFSLQS